MFVAQSAQSIDREYVPGLGEEVFDTQGRKTYVGDGYTKVKFLTPLEQGETPGDVIAINVEYNNAGSGMAADNVQAAIDETYQFAQSIDLELGEHLVDTTAHTADAITYNPALSGGVASTNVQGALDQHFLDTTAHSAINIPFTPIPTIVVTNVQAAIEDVETKVQSILAGGSVEASDISFVPVGPITADDVQDAIEQTADLAVAAQTSADTAGTNITAHLLDMLEAHTASAIKYVNSGVIADAFDVQDALDTLAAMINAAGVSRKYAASFGDNTAIAFTITHSFNTRDVTVQVYPDSAPYAQAECDVEHTDPNYVTLRFLTPPTVNQFRVVVMA